MNQNVFLDDVSITEGRLNVSEPGTLLLVRAVLAAGATVRRRKQNQLQSDLTAKKGVSNALFYVLIFVTIPGYDVRRR